MRHLFFVATYLPKKAIELTYKKVLKPCWKWWKNSETQEKTVNEENVELQELHHEAPDQAHNDYLEDDSDSDYEDFIENTDIFKKDSAPIINAPPLTEEINFEGSWLWGEKNLRPLLLSAWPWAARGWEKGSDFTYDAYLNFVNSVKSAGSYIAPWEFVTSALNGDLTDSLYYLEFVITLAAINFLIGEIRYFFKFKNSHTDNLLEWQELVGGSMILQSFLLLINPNLFMPILLTSIIIPSLKYFNPDFFWQLPDASGHKFRQTGARRKEKGEDTSSCFFRSLKGSIRVPSVLVELATPQVATHFAVFTPIYYIITPTVIPWVIGALAGVSSELFRLFEYRLSMKHDFSEIIRTKLYKNGRIESTAVAHLIIFSQSFYFTEAMRLIITEKRIRMGEHPVIFATFIMSSLLLSSGAHHDIVKVFDESFGNRSLRLDNLNLSKEDILLTLEQENKEEVESNLFNGREKEKEEKSCLSDFFGLFQPHTTDLPDDNKPTSMSFS